MNVYLLSALARVMIGIPTVWLMAVLRCIAGISGIAGTLLIDCSRDRVW